LLLGLIFAAAALAVWTAPVNLSPSGADAAEADVAVDEDGDVVFAWERSDGTNIRIQARARSAAGVLSPVQTLSQAGRDATEPDVAIDDDGDAVIAWERSDGTNMRVQAIARSAAGGLSPVQTLSSPGQFATRARAVMAPDGDAIFAWQASVGGGEVVQTRARSAAGVLSPVQDLTATANFSFSPDVAIEDDGDAVFTWTRFSFAVSAEQIQTRARSAAGALSAIQTLSAPGQPAGRPHVDVDSDTGDSVFIWQRSDGTHQRVQTRARTAAGALSAIQTLSASGQDAIAPEVGVDDGGNAVFAWERSDGTNLRIESRARTAAGALSPPQVLSQAGRDATDVELAIDRATGDTVFVWQRSDGTNTRVQARVRDAAGVLDPATTLSAIGANGDEPRVDVNDSGAAVSAWQRPVGAVERIQATVGP
jgi:hypothetical protein